LSLVLIIHNKDKQNTSNTKLLGLAATFVSDGRTLT